MPSGAKKRKAAKKRKEIHPNNNPNPSPVPTQGGGDVKQHDDRQSDFGEASSTASQDPSQQDLLTEGEEEKIDNGENVSNLPTVVGEKSEGDNAHGIAVEGIDVPVEREFKIEDEFNKKNGRFVYDETERKSYDGGSSGSSSSSSSSSDDESHGIKSSQAVVDHSLHVGNIEPVPTTTIGEASDGVVDSVPPVVSDKIALLSESVEVDTSSPANSSVAPSVVKPLFKENEEKKGSLEEQVGISETCKDAASQTEEATIPSVEKITSTFDPKACITEETDDRLSLSYNAPIVSLDNEADAEKDSGVTEPLLVPPPRPVETTSWKGCCGLFELFTGSGR